MKRNESCEEERREAVFSLLFSFACANFHRQGDVWVQGRFKLHLGVEVMSVPRCIAMFDGFCYVVVRLQVKWQLWISDTSRESTKWQRNPSCCSCLEL